MLSAAIQAEILRLRYAERWGFSQIARHLHIHRESARKVALRRSVALTPASPAPRTTVVTPFRARIQALLTEDPARSAVTICQVLRAEGYRGGISALRGAVRRLRPSAAPAAMATLTFGTGEAAQVDWGEFGDVFGIGRQVHAFVLVLCYSRLLAVTFTFSQTLEAFLRCHEQAFTFVGGCPKECWYDKRRRWPSGGASSSASILGSWPMPVTTASGRSPATSDAAMRRAASRTPSNTSG